MSNRYKSKHRWNKRNFNDDGSGDHDSRSVSNLGHRRDRLPGRRQSFPSEVLKRAVAMNLLPTPAGSSQAAQNTGLAHGESWARITVIQGSTQPLNAIQEMVNSVLGTQFRFYNVCIEGRNVILYAKIRQKQLMPYRKALQGLRDLSENKQLAGDITIVGEPRVPQPPSSKTPSATNVLANSLPDLWIEALQRCFVERFHAGTKNLDLSSLHTDPTLLSQGLYLPLNRTPVVHALINILKENAAKLSLLILSNNRLNHLNSFAPLSAIPEVSIERIDVSANPLTGVPALSGLRGINGLVDLDISETPIAGRFSKSDSHMVGTLLKTIPSLKRVNGEDLQSVRFAIERSQPSKSNVPLPPSTLGYFPNDEIRVPLLTFLKEYFTRYDTNPRGDNLFQYYTSASQLVLSVTVDRAPGFSSNPPITRIFTTTDDGKQRKNVITTGRLSSAYVARSRNLIYCHNEQRRKDSVARGTVGCASLLAELPPTEHPLESFTVDVIFHSPTQVLFTITGVFYELETLDSASTIHTRKLLRCFSRTMILVAPGGHVLQDDLVISYPSEALCKKYIKNLAPKSDKPPTDSTIAVPQIAPTPTTDARDLMLAELRQRSGMNETFSRQCLEEYQWNFEAAFSAFETLRTAGKLPPEAFV